MRRAAITACREVVAERENRLIAAAEWRALGAANALIEADGRNGTIEGAVKLELMVRAARRRWEEASE